MNGPHKHEARFAESLLMLSPPLKTLSPVLNLLLSIEKKKKIQRSDKDYLSTVVDVPVLCLSL